MMRTPLYEKHLSLGARMVEFAGWEMPVQYPTGIVEEHLRARRGAGLFDISHMGRFLVSGRDSLPFLQHALTNNAAALEPGKAQYTMIPNEGGGAIDDAYLYCLNALEYLLVVNAANRDKDWEHLQSIRSGYAGLELEDRTADLAMISLQGPESRHIMISCLGEEALPEPGRNNLTAISSLGSTLTVARTGYAGEPLGFELFVPEQSLDRVWDDFLAAGAAPIGLGARDTLRLEAGLPLYGHELGIDPENEEIPIFACPLARFAVSFSPLKKQFIGRHPLQDQFAVYRKIVKRDYSNLQSLPRIVGLFEGSAGQGDRPSGRRSLRRGSASRLGNQRHHGPVLDFRRRRSVQYSDRSE